MFGQIGVPEILLVLVVILLLFGAKRLPDMARGLGKSMRILKSEAKAMKNDGPAPSDSAPSGPQQTNVPRTIKAAPGDVTGSRPVDEQTHTPRA